MKHVVWILLLASVAFADEPVDIAELAALLKSDDPQEAAQAARSLGELGEEAVSAVPALVTALSDDRQGNQAQCFYSYATIADFATQALIAVGPSAVTNLVEELNTTMDSDSRYHIIATLKGIGPSAKLAIPQLKTIIEGDEVELVRYEALAAYCVINQDDEEKIVILQKSLKDRSPEVRATTAQYFGSMGKNAVVAVPALIEGLDDKEMYSVTVSNHFFMRLPVSHACAKALGSIGPAAAKSKERLFEIMRNEGGDRITAALAISQIEPGNDEAMELLISYVKEIEEDWFGTSLAAAEALVPLISQDERAVHALDVAMKYPNDEYREEVVRFIGQVRNSTAVSMLRKVLKGDGTFDDRAARAVAAESLGNLGDLAVLAVPDLIRAMYDNFQAEVIESKRGEYGESVFWEATTALGKIGPAAKSALDDLKLIQRSLDDEDLKELVTKTIERIETVE